MTFSTKYSLKTVLSAISETEPRTYQQIADKVGCSRETVRNILADYENICKSKELKGEFIEWKIKKEKIGHTYNVLKEKQLTESEKREKEIAELKRLIAKYPAFSKEKELKEAKKEALRYNDLVISYDKSCQEIYKQCEEYKKKAEKVPALEQRIRDLEDEIENLNAAIDGTAAFERERSKEVSSGTYRGD